MLVVAKEIDELVAVAKCRIASFPKSLSSKLGVNFVVNMLAFYLTGRNFLIYYKNEEGECVGYVTAMIPESGFSCSTRESINFTFNKLIIGLVKKPWLFFHPIVIKEYKVAIEMVLRRIKHISLEENSHANVPEELLNSAGLIDIAVQPKFQKQGYSSKLLKSFEENCFIIGIRRMHLSVKPENNSAIKSYIRNGWIILSQNTNQITFIKNQIT
jgi:GNAT superfamily N-acetyltransferase